MGRIYVGNLPHGKQDDVERELLALVTKVAGVQDVYFPELPVTGIPRTFAIVSLINSGEEDADPIKKCISTLNHCHWKGVKLRVERAREYFVNRLERERIETDNQERTLREKEAALVEETQNATVTLSKVNEDFNPPSVFRIKYNKDKYIHYKPKKKYNTLNTVFDMDASDDFDKSQVYADTNKENEKDKEKETTTLVGVGGGQRKGFGTLVGKSTTIKSNNTNAVNDFIDESCCRDGTVEHLATHPSILDRTPDWTNEFDAGDQSEEDNDNDNNNYAYEVDANPAVTKEDIQDAALKRERDRINAMLQSFAKGSTEGSAASASAHTDGSDAKPGFSTASSAARWSSFTGTRFDPTLDSSNDMELSAEDIQAMRQRSQEQSEGTTIQSIATPVELERDTKTFADLNALKDIYHREGGVWWGGEENKDAETRGTGVQDKLFMEAEKLGVDVRDGVGKTNDRGMSFGFFDKPTNSGTSTDTSNNATVFGFGFGSPQAGLDTVGTTKTSGLDAAWAASSSSHVLMNTDSNAYQNSHSMAGSMAMAAVPSMKDLLHDAQLFCREDTEEEVRFHWREQREKQVNDYKRRRKDARRRRANTDAKITLTPEVFDSASTPGYRRKRPRGGKRNK